MANRRKLENIAIALPVFGATVILPPIVGVFTSDTRIMGTPIIVVYMFSMWMLFILGTYLLSRRLRSSSQNDLDVTSEDVSGEG